ncbi:MAG: hypothetical protein ACP5N3_01630 [Candidatus Nanoarchaeia archaeon]
MFEQDKNSASSLEQVSIIINRYNLLVESINNLEIMQNKKELELEQIKRQTDYELEALRLKLAELKLLLDKASKYKASVSRDFKQIIKADSMNKLSRRIDAIDFENKISRDEFNHILER